METISSWYVLAVCLVYALAAWLVQMYRAVPPRDWLRERIWSLRARIETENWPPAAAAAAKEDLKAVECSVSGPAVLLPISRVQAGWRNVHGLEDDHVLELPDHVVVEQLKTTRSRLAAMRGTDAAGLVKRIDEALTPAPAPKRGMLAGLVAAAAACLLLRLKCESPNRGDDVARSALLQEANKFRHNVSDTSYEDRANLLGKTVWLTFIALAVVVALAFVFHREVYFLFGAAGALISRLSRVLKRRPRAADYGAEWSTLILSPAAGAVAGWVGVLIVSVLADPPFDVLNDRFSTLFSDATQPLGFVVAFVFGFSERLFDRLLMVAETKVGAQLPKEEEEKPAPQAQQPPA